MRAKTPATIRREATIDRQTVDRQNRTAVLSFSSEEPIRDFWDMHPQVLLHTKSAAKLKRIREIGAVLFNHDANKIVGRVDEIAIDEADRKGRAVVKFDETDDGNLALERVKSGSLRGVSVAARVDKRQMIEDGESWKSADGRSWDGPIAVATSWEVIELSLTPIPADGTVGVGRNRSGDMPKILDANGNEIEREPDVSTVERRRVDTILKIGERAGIGLAEARRWIDEGLSVVDAREIAMEFMADRYRPISTTGHRVEVGEGSNEKWSRAAQAGLCRRIGTYRETDAEFKGVEPVSRSLPRLAEDCLRCRAEITPLISARFSQHSDVDVVVGAAPVDPIMQVLWT